MGLLASGVLFDLAFYSAESGLSFASRERGIAHFLTIGEKLGFNPSPFFMWSWVRQQIGEAPVELYLKSAALVPPHPLFNADKVEPILKDPDWREKFSDWIKTAPLREIVAPAFLEDGQAAADPYAYFATVTSVNAQAPLETPFFSSRWYRLAYPDVAARNPLHHYLLAGWREGRDPSPGFSTIAYLRDHADVAASGANPLLHFVQQGLGEGRQPRPTRRYELAVRHQTLTETAPPSYVAFAPPQDLPPEQLSFASDKRLVIVVPFYKREDLVASLFGSLLACAAELRDIGVLIVCINDSPDYPALDEAIGGWFDAIDKADLDTIYLCNPVNRGFVTSSNTGLWIAEQLGAHCLLLNSDTAVQPGALTEMLAVLEMDDKFGFVTPRTNNATIATYGGRPLPPDKGYLAFRRSHALLPRYQIAPVGVGFCLLVRSDIIRLFGYLDPVYGAGYNEENDFILRANRRGFSAVLANHAFVAHLGRASFSLFSESPDALHAQNESVFLARYPEFKPAIDRYFSSAKFHAHRLIERDNDVDVLLDLRSATAVNNGTTKLIRTLAPYLFHELRDLKLAVAADPEVLAFLDLDIPASIRTIYDDSLGVKARLGFLFSQPFSVDVVNRMVYTCEKLGFFMLDSIATDCLYLQQDMVVELWEKVCATGDLFVFNSAYTMAKFAHRFQFRPDATLAASEHSMRPAEYGEAKTQGPRPAGGGSAHVLIFGNHYEHKGLFPALNALAGQGFDLTVFGAELARPDITTYAAGQVSDEQMAEIWSRCDVLVFPSFYEGFGFPVLESVGRRKPIVLLDTPLNRTLHRRLGSPKSFFFFSAFRELPEIVATAARFNGPWLNPAGAADDGWLRSAREIAAAIRKTLEKPLKFDTLQQRLSSLSSVSKPIV
jgi:GT2 family glycosyltransferase